MKLTATYHRKQAIEGVPFSSHGFHLAIEAEPPPEIREDRQKLAEYARRLFAECRSRVEAELSGTGDPPAPRARPSNSSDRGGPRSLRNGRSRRGPVNGHTSGTRASLKQVNYLRALSTEAGLSYDDLADLASDLVGKADVRALTKREASQLIDELRNGDG